MNIEVKDLQHLLPTLGIVLLMAACVSVEGDWERAMRTGTIDSYERFIQNHPDAEQVCEAQKQLQELQLAKTAQALIARLESDIESDSWFLKYAKETSGLSPFVPVQYSLNGRKVTKREWTELLEVKLPRLVALRQALRAKLQDALQSYQQAPTDEARVARTQLESVIVEVNGSYQSAGVEASP